jgi:CRP/FNR family cyclic AMP-dependent transcriptional regulator
MAIPDDLAKVPLFRDLNKKALERLAKVARPRNFRSGEQVVKEGDEGVGFFLINSGKVDVTRGGTHLNSLGAGQFFGEMALLDNYRRSATVTASEPTACLGIMRSDFIAELRGSPDIAVEMLTLMSRRIRELDQRLAEE